MSGLSRREMLLGVGGIAAGATAATGAVAVGLHQSGDDARTEGHHEPSSDVMPPTGPTQAGVDRPGTPQRFGLLAVLDLPDVRPDETAHRLARLGGTIVALVRERSPGSGPDGPGGPPEEPGDLTVTVGVGPRVVAAVDPDLPGATDLPRFAHDDAIAEVRTGGDVLLALHGSDPAVLSEALRSLRGTLGDATLRWSEHCYRGPGRGTVARNPLGFHDGIAVPHSAEELARDVWLPGPADGGDVRVAGGTICVLRRLVLDTDRFARLSVRRQESVIGRRRSDGAPLSGGGPSDDVDLRAKTPQGEYLVPADSHARAAHPSFTGSRLMLRRGYAFSTPSSGGTPGESGLFFVCFQREIDTFVRTQHRLDETDALGSFVTPTASATFLVLPGFDDARPLGSTLLT